MPEKDNKDILKDDFIEECTTDTETLATAERAETDAMAESTEANAAEDSAEAVSDDGVEKVAQEVAPKQKVRKSVKKKAFVTLISIVACLAVMVCVIVPTIYEHGILNIHNLKSAKDGQIRVACVGDSITYGCMVPNWTRNNYPAQLENLLGGG